MNFTSDKDGPDMSKFPTFYKQVISAFHSAGGGGKNKPSSVSEIMGETIWCNKYIRSQGKTIFFPTWINKDIIFIKDIFPLDRFMSLDHYPQLNLTTRPNGIIEYITLFQAIPLTWKNAIRNHRGPIPYQRLELNTISPCIFDGKTTKQMKSKNTCKLLYNTIVQAQAKEPTCCKRWQSIFPTETLTWENIWRWLSTQAC